MYIVSKNLNNAIHYAKAIQDASSLRDRETRQKFLRELHRPGQDAGHFFLHPRTVPVYWFQITLHSDYPPVA